MEEDNFKHLAEILCLDISVDVEQSMKLTSGGGLIVPELVVTARLRFLGGELPKSIADILGMSLSLANRCIDKFLGKGAYSDANELSICLPDMDE